MSATIQRTATLTMSNNTSTSFLGKNRERCPKLEMRLTVSNVIKLAAKEEAAEGHRIPKEIQKELIRKKRQQKQTEAAPSEKGYRKGQRAEA